MDHWIKINTVRTKPVPFEKWQSFGAEKEIVRHSRSRRDGVSVEKDNLCRHNNEFMAFATHKKRTRKKLKNNLKKHARRRVFVYTDGQRESDVPKTR